MSEQDKQRELYLYYASVAAVVLYYIVSKIGSLCSGWTFHQVPGFMGFYLYAFVLIISLIGFFAAKDTYAQAREITLYIYAVLVFYGIILTCLYGGLDFKALPEVTGPFGVGAKHIFSDKTKQSIIVMYPIDKSNWDVEMQDENIWFEKNIFGDEKTRIGNARVMQHNMKASEIGSLNRVTDGIKFPAKKNAVFDASQ